MVWATVIRLFAFPIAPLIFAYIILIFFEGFLPWFLVRHFLLTFLNVTFFFEFSFSGLFPLYFSWCGFLSIVCFQFKVFCVFDGGPIFFVRAARDFLVFPIGVVKYFLDFFSRCVCVFYVALDGDCAVATLSFLPVFSCYCYIVFHS